MNIRNLEYLLAVADAGSLRAAAEQCGVAQPTLSMQLARLEELDCLLFERGRRGTRLTPRGERVVAEARHVIEAVHSLRKACRVGEAPLAGPFRLGMIPTVGPYLTPDVVPAIRKSFPEIELRLREETTAQLLKRLRDGELDAAVLAEPVDHAGMHKERILTEPFLAAMPADHPLAKRKSIDFQSLANDRLLLLEEGHCLRDQTLELCQLRSDPTDVQASSVESLRQMVAAGVGLTVLPRMAVAGRWARWSGVVTLPVKPENIVRTLVLTFRRTHPEFGSIVSMASCMRQAVEG